MKTVAEYLNDCVSVAQPLPPFRVVLDGAVGCVLAQDVHSSVDVPARDLAALDGYAVRVEDVFDASADSPVVLPVIDEVRAGAGSGGSIIPRTCVRVSSGAPLPSGANAVIPLPDTDQGRAQVQIFVGGAAGDNVRRRAEDLAAGQVVLRKGVRIGARQVALLAAAGYSSVLVHPAPRVVIVTVGDELVEPGQMMREGGVYDANSHALGSAVADAGGEVFRAGQVSDDKHELRENLEDQLVRADIILITGGLSYGGGDTVKEVLSPLGTVRFDNVAIWPGRQFGVGTVRDDGSLSGTAGAWSQGDKTKPVEQATIYCLPGDPVAALTAFEVFIRPALRHMAGYTHIHRRSIRAKAVRAWAGTTGVQEFVSARVVGDPARGYTVEPLGEARKPSLTAYAHANALMVVPANLSTVAVGDELDCIVLD